MNPSTALAREVVRALLAAGVREVVLCPGSRSAPLAYALHAADVARALRLHVRHDERVAGFTALGVGRSGAGPAAVVTTSGTAVANLWPAALEAHHGGVPLLLLTADRPARLRGTWANQSSDLQPGLFGGAVRRAATLPDPGGAAPGDVVAAAVACCRGLDGGRPGAVQLDVGFDEPLVPDDDEPPVPDDDEPLASGDEPLATGDVRATGDVPVAPGGGLPLATGGPAGTARPGTPGPGAASELARGPRTVVVAGDGAGDDARALAEGAGWPLLAEPTSGARSGDAPVAGYRLLLPLAGFGDAVQRVVVLGRPTLSRPVTALLARPDVELVQVAHPDAPGPGRPVRRLTAPPRVPGAATPEERDWLRRWSRGGRAAGVALDAVLDAEAAAGRLPGPLLAREVAAVSGPRSPLVVAASNAVRDLDLAARPWPAGTRVLANRGVAGIDGTVSTAGGVALATRRPTRVLVGDVAFLHDATALLLGPGEPEPDLQVVVLDDDGGGIFDLLEHGEPGRRATAQRLFATPHGVDVTAVAAALGVPARSVGDLAALRAALAGPPPGRSVLRVPSRRARLRGLHHELRRRVREAAG